MPTADILAVLAIVITLALATLGVVAKVGQWVGKFTQAFGDLKETVDELRAELRSSLDVEQLERRHAVAEVHDRIDQVHRDLFTPRPGRANDSR